MHGLVRAIASEPGLIRICAAAVEWPVRSIWQTAETLGTLRIPDNPKYRRFQADFLPRRNSLCHHTLLLIKRQHYRISLTCQLFYTIIDLC